MKKHFPLSLFAIITCLVSIEGIVEANPVKRLYSSTAFLENFQKAQNKFDEEAIALCKKYLDGKLPKTENKNSSLKTFIAGIIGLATGITIGQNQEKILKTFDEKVRPAITLPTEEQRKEIIDKSSIYLKEKFKQIALKNPHQTETKTDANAEAEKSK